MKHLKKFENLKEEPKIGDYVFVRDDFEKSSVLDKFLATHIGQIVNIENENTEFSDIEFSKFYSKFENDGSINFRSYFHVEDDYSMDYGTRWFYRNEIIGYDSDPEKLDLYITANKYNM